ncbi:MAG: hypothetical protein WBP39_04970, partial [Candidatus Phosphoribacter baldrii]
DNVAHPIHLGQLQERATQEVPGVHPPTLLPPVGQARPSLPPTGTYAVRAAYASPAWGRT